MSEQIKRRLTAILTADVVEYTKLMAQDEDGTLVALHEHRQRLFNPEIAKRGGRIVKLMGDGTLVEFPSVVDAVEAALSIQKAGAANDDTIKLRIGINLGDVIIDGDDIYGEGVNVAARLEELAEPGGICISFIVHQSLGNRVDTEFVDAGEHQVKNIARPIRVFRWPARRAESGSGRELIPTELKRDHTISVLPFESLSSDEDLSYLCEGIAQDIITAIGNIEQLTVVAEEHRVAKDKAHYILTGKVRKFGNRIRVSAQLVDRHSGVQHWADRFNREASDLFEVQDDVARNIVIAIHTELGAGSYHNSWQWGTENFEAWQLMAKGFREFQKFSPDSIAKTASIWEQALTIDPDYLAPLMGSGYCYAHLALVADADKAQEYIARAQSIFERSAAQAPKDIRPYATKRGIEIALGNYDGAVAAAQTAFNMRPNDPHCRAALAVALLSADRPAEALPQITKAIQDATDPAGWYILTRIQCNYMLGKLAEAFREGRDTVTRIPDFYPGPVLTAALAIELGEKNEAEAMRKKVLKVDPQFSATLFVRSLGLKNIKHRKRVMSALKAAGLPE